MAQRVEAGAHHLGLAAQAIGILDPFVADAMAFPDGASRQQRAQGCRDRDLPGMSAQRVDARVEGRIRPFGRVGRQGAGDQGRLEDALGFEQAGQGIGRGKLRPVQQCQPFLGRERHRLQPDLGEARRGRHDLIAQRHLADADHRRRHVGERRQVARRPDRSLRRHDGQEIAVEHGRQQLHRRAGDAGIALRQRRELQRHHQAHDGRRRRGPDARGVRQHDVALEDPEVGRLDANVGEFPEAGVDAVNRLASPDDPCDGCSACRDPVPAGRVERRRCAAIDLRPCRKRNVAGFQFELHRPLRGSRSMLQLPS